MKLREFKLKSKYQPTGDQPQAISQLVEGLKNGEREQTLLEVEKLLRWRILFKQFKSLL